MGHGTYSGGILRGGRIVPGFRMRHCRVIGDVVGQLGEAGLRRLQMLDRVWKLLLFKRNHTQGEMGERAVDVPVAEGVSLESFAPRGSWRFAVGAAERFGALGE